MNCLKRSGTFSTRSCVLPGVQHHRPGGRAAFRIRAVGLLLLAGYLVFLGWLALRPVSVPWVAPSNIELFATIEPELEQGPLHALRSLGGDLALLAPLGVLLPLSSGSCGSRTGSFFRTVIAAGMLACGMEALRSAVPGQLANIDSALLYTTGAALTHLLLYPVVRALFRRMSPATSSPPSPGASGASGASHEAGTGPKVHTLPVREPSQGSPLRSTRVRLAPRADVSRSGAPYV